MKKTIWDNIEWTPGSPMARLWATQWGEAWYWQECARKRAPRICYQQRFEEWRG